MHLKYISSTRIFSSRFTKIFLLFCACAFIGSSIGKIVSHNTARQTAASAQSSNWGLSFQEEGKRPVGNATIEELAQYNAFFAEDTEEKKIYLTFDAGFENGNTPAILDALKKHQAPATFFVVGNFISENQELIKRMEAEGHIVGNHTMTHPDMSKISTQESFQKELSGVEDIYKEGGTILYSSNKDNLFDYLVDDGHGGKVKKDVSDVAVENLKKDGVDVLVILGGDGTLTSARDFSRKGVNVIGVPKTMDNDLASTDVTYGFISAMSVGTEFIDRLQTTAKSHHRVICCELMGRDAGWITLYAGLAGNAGVCLIPEIPFTIENIAKAIKKRDEMGLPYTVVAVAEGAKYADGTKVIGKIVEDSPDPVRYSGLAAKVADDLEKVIPNHEVRSVNPGHIIRGGDITAYDRILSIRYGVAAVELINEGKFGNVVTINGDKMGYTSLEEVIGAAKIGQQKHVDPNGELVKAAKAIGISFGDE